MTLAGLINREQGGGVADEGLRALGVLNTLGADTWMTLGDKDFGLHIYRTARRKAGDSPSAIAVDVAEKFGVPACIVLPTDDRVQTRVRTAAGWLSFQEYFVREQCGPEVLDLAYEGLDTARPTQAALNAIAGADIIVFAPSNPLVSLRPILGITGISEAIRAATAPTIAVSPLIAGRVVKGPADKMMTSLGMRADAVGVAAAYRGLISSLLIDSQDAGLSPEITATGAHAATSDIMMRDLADKMRVAQDIIGLAQANPGKPAVA